VTTRKRYTLRPHGKLLWTKAAFGYQDNELVITARLLIDTGASYTVLSDRLVRSILDQPVPIRQESIMTASSIVSAPVVAVPWINCLGKQIFDFPIVSLSLPTNAFIDGLVGIDFLRFCGAVIDVDRAEILITK
jgi:predicted aspartyl protease